MSGILFYDIESTNLNADFGVCLCIGYMWENEKKPHIISIRGHPAAFKKKRTNDFYVVKDFGEIVKKADLCVYHYGSRFDLPFINTRRLIHNLPPMPPVRDIDTWWLARKYLKLHSNRLASLIEAFGVSEKKTPLNGPIWIDAAAGYGSAIKYVEEHCLADVISLKAVYNRIRSVSGQIFPKYLNPPGNPGPKPEMLKCRVCGGNNTRKWGLMYTKDGAKKRIFCNDCYTWVCQQIPKKEMDRANNDRNI